MAKLKLYKCPAKAKGCQITYVKFNSFKSTCNNPACALKKATADREKKEAEKRLESSREKRKGREALMSMPARLKRAREKSFQVWVKLRDFAWFASIGKDPACIMCGNTNPKAWHACHFQSVGSKPELQYHPDNCHLGCGQCNFFAAQSDTQYEQNLVIKIGQERVDYLKNYNATIRWDAEEVEEIRAHYGAMAKELK